VFRCSAPRVAPQSAECNVPNVLAGASRPTLGHLFTLLKVAESNRARRTSAQRCVDVVYFVEGRGVLPRASHRFSTLPAIAEFQSATLGLLPTSRSIDVRLYYQGPLCYHPLFCRTRIRHVLRRLSATLCIFSLTLRELPTALCSARRAFLDL